MIPKSKQGYRQPAFWICAGLLAVCGLGLSTALKVCGGVLRKEPLPLKRSFDTLDRRALYPYRVIRELHITNPDLLQSLGTRDYLQWVLQDTAPHGPNQVDQVLLFVTYYPLPNRVPHVPEECYLGSGFQPLASDHVSLALGEPNLPHRIEAKYLVFGRTHGGPWDPDERVGDLYFFKVNGVYAADRDEARMVLNENLLGRSSYFSKVELVFNRGGETVQEDQVIATATKLLRLLLPVLENDYWPTFK